jgi:hypothetical protein
MKDNEKPNPRAPLGYPYFVFILISGFLVTLSWPHTPGDNIGYLLQIAVGSLPSFFCYQIGYTAGLKEAGVKDDE